MLMIDTPDNLLAFQKFEASYRKAFSGTYPFLLLVAPHDAKDRAKILSMLCRGEKITRYSSSLPIPYPPNLANVISHLGWRGSRVGILREQVELFVGGKRRRVMEYRIKPDLANLKHSYHLLLAWGYTLPPPPNNPLGSKNALAGLSGSDEKAA